MLVVRVIGLDECVEGAHCGHRPVNELVAVCGDAVRNDKLAACEQDAEMVVGRAQRIIECADA